MDTLEYKVKVLINNSLNKRIAGLGDIDNITSNELLIQHWMTAISVLGKNDENVELAAEELNTIQSIFGQASIEDTRAFLFLASNRFCEEIAAYCKYLELKDNEQESIVLLEVAELLESIEEGELLYS